MIKADGYSTLPLCLSTRWKLKLSSFTFLFPWPSFQSQAMIKNYFVYTEMTLYLLTLKLVSWTYVPYCFHMCNPPILTPCRCPGCLDCRIKDWDCHELCDKWERVSKLFTLLQAELLELFRHVNTQRKTKNSFWKAFSWLGTKPQDFKGPRM